MARTLVLGAGFGGLAVATGLRERLGTDHEVVLVDRQEHFAMGLRKLWAIAGIGSLEAGQRSRRTLDGDGVSFIQREIVAIDPASRTATTDEGTLEADALVVALGAQGRPDLVPGLAEHGHDVWNPAGVPALAGALARFQGGTIAIVIAGVPYTCPPAPYECAMLLDEHLRRRGLRDATELVVSTVQPILMPNAGREGSAWIGEQLAARGIAFHTGRKVERVQAGRVVFADGDLGFDVLICVPPHRAPAVVKDSGLTGDGEWVAVDSGTLGTAYPDVYAVGDVTQIMLANGLPLPKAGLFAELEGTRVAAAIAAARLGEEPPPPFDGRGYCFIEMGSDAASLVEGDFFAEPEPRVEVRDVSAANAEAKREFEAERLGRWFGR